MKQSFIRIYEPAEKVVHIDAPGGLDCVTLCGKTDWLGEESGYETNRPVTCWHCQQIAAFCQRHRRLTTKRKSSQLSRPLSKCATCGGLGRIPHESGGYGINCPSCTVASHQLGTENG